MPFIEPNFSLHMSEFLPEIPEHVVDLEPIAFLYFCMKEQYWRRLGVLPSIIDMEVQPVELTLLCNLYDLLLPESSNFKFAEMFSLFNIHPHIHERLIAQTSGRACEMAVRAVEAGQSMLFIIVNVELVITTVVTEEESLAWALAESTEFAEQSGCGAVPASRASIGSLKRRKYKRRDSDQSKCTICLDKFSKGVDIIQMPCSHIFHNGCITKWLGQNHVCPLCRSEVMPEMRES